MEKLKSQILTKLNKFFNEQRAFSIHDLTKELRRDLFIAKHEDVRNIFLSLLNDVNYKFVLISDNGVYRMWKVQQLKANATPVSTQTQDNSVKNLVNNLINPNSASTTRFTGFNTPAKNDVKDLVNQVINGNKSTASTAPTPAPQVASDTLTTVATLFKKYCVFNDAKDYVAFSNKLNNYILTFSNKGYPLSQLKKRVRDRFKNEFIMDPDFVNAVVVYAEKGLKK